MLQPVQLREVSLRYPAEIAELREFLAKAGFSAGSTQALSQVASRLQHDRAFHRDLILNMWVLIDRSGGTVSHSDLLGILAVGAAGEQFAAQASEEDAHDLLRFIMEARRSMDALTHRTVAEPATFPSSAAPEAPAGPTQHHEAQRAPEAASPHVVPEVMTSPHSHSIEQGGSNRLAWGVALALSLLVAASVAVWQHRAAPSTQDRSPAPIVSAPVTANGTEVSPQVASGPSVTSSSELSLRNKALSPDSQPTSTVAGERAARRTYEAPRAAASAAPYSVPRTSSSARADGSVPGPIVRTPSVAGNATPSAPSIDRGGMRASVPVRPGATRPAIPAPVPATTLSSQLGSSSIPAYSALPDADATTDGRKYPRLLRRRTSSNASSNLVAEVRTPGPPNSLDSNRAAVPVGVVRPTSLGIMAGNLLYSPTPAYPAAAAAAHVQGEVKVQAEIDRDGNVVSARVVSGPPMLRDAAVDAIQHWRYKPWTAGGKTVAASALAVVEFQLP